MTHWKNEFNETHIRRLESSLEEEAKDIVKQWHRLDQIDQELTPKQKQAVESERAARNKNPIQRLHRLAAVDESITNSFRMKLGLLVYSNQFEGLIGLLVIANLVSIVIETDINARGEDMPPWLKFSNILFIVLYGLELLARIYIERAHFIYSSWNIFDAMIVVIGVTGEFIQGVMDQVSVLRTMRLLRSLRLVRLLNVFPELATLIRDVVRCLRTLMWTFCLLFLSITVWSIFAVELLHPMMADVSATGVYDRTDCPWCDQAFSSVMKANLTLFQIVTGDGWSMLARPIIEHNPWTALIFIGIIFSLFFGLLNVLIACMVENAARSRMAETHMLALEREEQKERGRHCFLRLCEKLDVNGDGVITLEEMKEGCHTVHEFRDLLTVMDIGADDIECVFKILDEDDSGGVSHEEFVEQLWKMKSQEMRTLLAFVKYYVVQIWQKMIVESNKRTDSLQDSVSQLKEELNLRSDSLMRAVSDFSSGTPEMKFRVSETMPHFCQAINPLDQELACRSGGSEAKPESGEQELSCRTGILNNVVTTTVVPSAPTRLENAEERSTSRQTNQSIVDEGVAGKGSTCMHL